MKTHRPRQPLLDVFRGFAIFGIFVVNITIMHSVMMFQDAYYAQFQDSTSAFITKLLQLFFYNKFFPIFSFLFGLGLSMQMQNRRREQSPYIGFFARRMLLLFLFGIAHIVFLWSGDVLHLYAILGLCCIFLIRLSRKVLIGMAVILLIFPFYNHLALWFAGLFSPSLESSFLAIGEQSLIETIRSESYLTTINIRTAEYAANLGMLLFYLAPMALAMFLLGIAAGKGQVKFGTEAWLKSSQSIAVFTLVVTTLYRLFFLWVLPSSELYQSDALRPLWFKVMFISDVTFGLFYLWAIAWLWHKARAVSLLTPFSYVGRMALTNYILQSGFGLFLFTNLGFALYQTLEPVECFMLAIAIFGIQVLFSKLWLVHFKYGPLEWLWRCGSYLSLFSLRRNNAKSGEQDK